MLDSDLSASHQPLIFPLLKLQVSLLINKRQDCAYQAVCLAFLIMMDSFCVSSAIAQGATQPEEVVVKGKRVNNSKIEVDKLDSASLIDIESISKAQAADVFDILRNEAGISVVGGARTSGKSISIRGFSDNEDVLIQIDGISQNFEKYRYGSGIDIDPELLKEIAVFRGGSSVAQGSGYLGGVVKMETKDASDFLSPGQTYGVDLKTGYSTNNDGQVYALTTYAAPVDNLDVLASVTKRQTNDYELPDGTRFAQSDEAQVSGLGKLEFEFRGNLLSASQRYSEDSGREPFDATGGITGVGGAVRRETRESATSLRHTWASEAGLISLDNTLGYIDKTVIDFRDPAAGGGTDTFDYKIWTLNISNTSTFDLGPFSNKVSFGIQGNRETRVVTRENDLFSGFNRAQPSGEKRTWAAYAEGELSWRRWRFHLGVRADQYDIAVKDDLGSILAARGEEDEISFSEVTPNIGLDYNWGPFDLFYRYTEGFRAPLLDEYFSRGDLSRCFNFAEFERPPAPMAVLDLPSAPIAPSVPVLADFGGDIATYLAALNSYNTSLLPTYLAALAAFPDQLQLAIDQFETATAADILAQEAFVNNPNGQDNASCGNHYRPEEAVTHETGIAMTLENAFAEDDLLNAKIVYFDTRISNLIESIFQDATTLAVEQPGVEVRKGVEFEVSYNQPSWFVTANLSVLTGYVQFNYFDNNIDPRVSALSAVISNDKVDLFNIPGNHANITVGGRLQKWQLEFGHTLRAIDSRIVSTGNLPGCDGGLFTIPSCLDKSEQSGYVTSNIFASWRPRSSFDIRLTVDNLLNKSFLLSGFGGGLGAEAPGRDIRISFRYRY